MERKRMNDVAAIILAAGQASRYRAQDASVASKVIASLEGKPLIRHVAEAALAAHAHPVIVVTGHAQDEVAHAVRDMDISLIHNRDFMTGMASSLQAGMAAVPEKAMGALILLADMPRIDAALLVRLVETLRNNPGAGAIVPVHNHKRGNPVLIARSLFPSIAGLSGDEGARRILNRPDVKIVEIEAGENVTLDIDTPGALKKAAACK